MVVLGGLGLLVGIVLEDMWWLVGDRLQGLDSLWTVIGKRAPLAFPCRSKIKTGEDGNSSSFQCRAWRLALSTEPGASLSAVGSQKEQNKAIWQRLDG
jgi:hypothetical protein